MGADTDILERWVAEYQPLVYRAAAMILRDPAAAEDVAQEAFLRAYRAAGRLQPGSEIKSWLYRIATNLAINQLRKCKAEARALAKVGVSPETTDDLSERRATRAAVTAAIDRLPDRLRIPVILRYYLDCSEAEMAKTLNVRPGTVKSRLNEARRLLSGDDAIAAASS